MHFSQLTLFLSNASYTYTHQHAFLFFSFIQICVFTCFECVLPYHTVLAVQTRSRSHLLMLFFIPSPHLTSAPPAVSFMAFFFSASCMDSSLNSLCNFLLYLSIIALHCIPLCLPSLFLSVSIVFPTDTLFRCVVCAVVLLVISVGHVFSLFDWCPCVVDEKAAQAEAFNCTLN